MANGAVLDKETGVLELLDDVAGDLWNRPETWSGLGLAPFPVEVQAKLREPVRDDEIEILPTGAVYLSHAGYRRRLFDAFGVGGWGLRPLTPMVQQGPVLVQWWQLIALGRVVGSGTGEHAFDPEKANDSKQMSLGDVTESIKSNALIRCCKEIGVALELWDRGVADAFRDRLAFKVWIEGQQKPQWRRIDKPAFFKESGLCDDSPNREKYTAPQQGRGNRGGGGQQQGQQQRQQRQQGQQQKPAESNVLVKEAERKAAEAKVAEGKAAPAEQQPELISNEQVVFLQEELRKLGVSRDQFDLWVLEDYGVSAIDKFPRVKFREMVTALRRMSAGK